jgi:hypothetical protein
MLDRVTPRKLDAWGLKAEFDQRIETAESLLSAEAREQAVVPYPTDSGKTTDASASRTENVSPLSYVTALSPKAMILEAWGELEMTSFDLAWRTKPEGERDRFSTRRVEAVAQFLGLGGDGVAAVSELRKLRNAVAHAADFQLTMAEALRYRASVERLIQSLSEAAKKKAGDDAHPQAPVG